MRMPINWWLDKGVAGFRLDVIDQIAKDPELQVTCNGPRLHEFIRELSRETPGQIMIIPEKTVPATPVKLSLPLFQDRLKF